MSPVRTLYSAFQRRDGPGMARCYGPTARFSDPVFPELAGPRIGAMWSMLCEAGEDLRIEFDIASEDEHSAVVNWQAWYGFGPSRRPVHNRVEAQLRLDGGSIVEHVDAFGFQRWAAQALGPVGFFLGWTPWLRRKVQQQAERGLGRWERDHAAA